MKEEKSKKAIEELTTLNSANNKKLSENLEFQRFKERFESPEWMLAQLALDFVLEGEFEKAKRFAEEARKIERMKFSSQENLIREELENFKKSFGETLVQKKEIQQTIIAKRQAVDSVVLRKEEEVKLEAQKQMTPGQRVNQRGDEVKQRLKQVEIDEFLTAVYRGNLQEVERLLIRDKKFASAQGDITDLSDREFKKITAFQYAYWALDVEMCEMILQYLPKEEAKNQLLAFEVEQAESMNAHGKHYSFDSYLRALKKYLDNLYEWSVCADKGGAEAMATFWCVKVGGAQRGFPAWMILLMKDKGGDVAWREGDFRLEFQRDDKHLKGWFVCDETHHLGANPNTKKWWKDPLCGFSWGPKLGGGLDVWWSCGGSWEGFINPKLFFHSAFLSTLNTVRLEAMDSLHHRLCGYSMSASINLGQNNKEVNHHIDNRKIQDIRSFDQDYTIETLTYLVHINPCSYCLRYVFKSGIKDQFIEQLRSLKFLVAEFKCPAFFISPTPAEMDSSHFVCGILYDNALLLINPLGEKLTKDSIEILKRISDKNSRDHVVETLFISADVLQKDPEGQYSCGPICVDVVSELSKIPEEIRSLFRKWKQLPEEKRKRVDQLLYQPVSIRSLCVSDQVDAMDTKNAQEVIGKIRQVHFDTLCALELSNQEGNTNINFDALMNSPEQVLIFKLAFEQLNLNDCLEHGEFKKLQARLKQYGAAENKSKSVDAQKDSVAAVTTTKSEVDQHEKLQMRSEEKWQLEKDQDTQSENEKQIQADREKQSHMALIAQKQSEAQLQITPGQRVSKRAQEVKQQQPEEVDVFVMYPVGLRKAEIDEFLTAVYLGNIDKARACFKLHPELGSAQGDIKDLSGREFKQITAFQYAYWALDMEMCELILSYLPESEAKDQLLALENERADIVKAHGAHYNFDTYLTALKKYLDNFELWVNSYDRDGKDAMANCKCLDIGAAERGFPSWMIMLMSEEGNDVAWVNQDLRRGFERAERYLYDWFVQEKTHRLGAEPNLKDGWKDPQCGYSWSRGRESHPISMQGNAMGRLILHDHAFCTSVRVARTEAMEILRQRLCSAVETKPISPGQSWSY